MFDYNVFHADDLDIWTDDVGTARQIAAAYHASTGRDATITRYPMRETPDGWGTDTLAGGEVIA